jgi:transposase
MTILTKQERERLVLQLYNQGKTIREIAKEVRISFRDIGVILNKAVEDKSEEIKQHLSLVTQAYKLFSDRKTPLEVAITLNLEESEATKFYKEYWKLKQLCALNLLYEDLRGDIEPFLKLYKLAKRKGMGIKQVVNLLEMSNNDLPDIQRRYERLKREVSTLEFNKQQSHKAMADFNNQIEMKCKALTSYRLSCIRERREIEKLYNEKARLETIITGFKRSNEEYLNRVKHVAYEEVKTVLTNGKLLLHCALASVIESLRRNPELCNFVIHDNNIAISYRPNYPSFMLSDQQRQEQSFNARYAALILEEAEKLYNKLITEFTNRGVAAAASIRASSLAVPGNNNKQKLSHKIDNT